MRRKRLVLLAGLTALLLSAQESRNAPFPNTQFTAEYGVRQAQLWDSIKKGLLNSNGPNYWEQGVQCAELPGGANGVRVFLARVISIQRTPSGDELVAAILPGTVAEARLRTKIRLDKSIVEGSRIAFSGVAKEFRNDPFEIVLDVGAPLVLGKPMVKRK